MLLAAIPARFDQIEGRVSSLEKGLSLNNATTERIGKGTARIVAFVEDVDIVWRFCTRFRRATFRLSKWIAAMSAAVAGVVAAAQAVGAIDVKTLFK